MIEIRAETVEALETTCRAFLEGRGFSVIGPGDNFVARTQAELAGELGVGGSTLSRWLHHRDCPPFVGLWSKRGHRLESLEPNKRLMEWLRAQRDARRTCPANSAK